MLQYCKADDKHEDNRQYLLLFSRTLGSSSNFWVTVAFLLGIFYIFKNFFMTGQKKFWVHKWNEHQGLGGKG